MLSSKHIIGDEIITYDTRTKNCKETRLHYSNLFPHGTERKTVTVAKVCLASKEEQQQSLHYHNYFPQELYAVKFPVIIAEKNSGNERGT